MARGLGRKRSIPASAGQPCPSVSIIAAVTVYPRECGAAYIMQTKRNAHGGLSPRVRGSLMHSGCEQVTAGLSPRVRGSRDDKRPPTGTDGSIPASAGQPPPVLSTEGSVAVYPRECGAARMMLRDPLHKSGLSPRVRGSRPTRVSCTSSQRSIPASAGQPHIETARITIQRVYPRECGAAERRGRVPCSDLGLSPRVRGSH